MTKYIMVSSDKSPSEQESISCKTHDFLVACQMVALKVRFSNLPWELYPVDAVTKAIGGVISSEEIASTLSANPRNVSPGTIAKYRESMQLAASR